MKTYLFDRNATDAQRDGVVIGLRRDGFSASREMGTLRTNATLAQIALSCGRGWLVSARWIVSPA